MMDEPLIEKMCKVSGQPRDVIIELLKEAGYLSPGRRPDVAFMTQENATRLRKVKATLDVEQAALDGKGEGVDKG